MSQAIGQPIQNSVQINRCTKVTGDTLDLYFPGNAPYALIVDGRQVFADPREKGEPGDIVVVWPKKRGPRLARKLARHEIDDSLYFFAMLDSGTLVSVPHNKVTAIHRVVDPIVGAS